MSDKKTMGWAHLIRGGSLGKVSQAAMSGLGGSWGEVLNKPMLQYNGHHHQLKYMYLTPFFSLKNRKLAYLNSIISHIVSMIKY